MLYHHAHNQLTTVLVIEKWTLEKLDEVNVVQFQMTRTVCEYHRDMWLYGAGCIKNHFQLQITIDYIGWYRFK